MEAPFVSLSRVLALLAVVLAARSARAEPRLFVELTYETDAALDACPSEARFGEMISEQLHYDPFRSPGQYKVVARARATEQGMLGVVEWYDAAGDRRGERELHYEGVDCSALARALSFAITVQIQLLAKEHETAVKAAESPPAPANTTVVTAPTAPARPEEEDARRKRNEPPDRAQPHWQIMVGAGPAAGFGLAPRFVVTGRVFAAVRYEAFVLELGAEASLPSRHTTEPGKGFEQRLVVGSLAGCGLFGAVSACLVGNAGRLEVTGFGVDIPRSSSGTIAQVGPRIALTNLMSSQWLGALYVEALATLFAWEVTLNQREVWKTPPVTLSVGADLAFLLP